MENLRFNIAAGETKVFVKAGRYFEILESGGPVTMAFYDANGSQNNDASSVLSGTYLEDSFSQFDIYSATAQTVEILISDGKGGTRRQPGTVQVIDGERNKVLQGVCFRGVGQQSTTNAAGVQVWNPAGSGRNIFVQAVRVGATTADAWSLATTDFQLAGGGIVPANLDRAGANSIASVRTGDASGITNSRGYGAGYMAANTDVVLVFPRPILIRPGFGIVIAGNAASNTVRATFEWEEWPL